MGCVTSKCREEAERLRSRVQFLEEELQEARCGRDKETQAREHCATLLASREEEWKRENKWCNKEVAALKRRMEEEEEGRRTLVAAADSGKADHGWQQQQQQQQKQQVEMCFLLEQQMRVEQARKETAVEKWKKLYLAVKTELDDLIQQAHHHQGERFCWTSEDQETIGILQRELKAREQTVEDLRHRLVAMEDAAGKRHREIDILRQSLRILSNSKGRNTNTRQSVPKCCVRA